MVYWCIAATALDLALVLLLVGAWREDRRMQRRIRALHQALDVYEPRRMH